MVNQIQIVNPMVRRGSPPRQLTKADIITVPVDYQRGEWRTLDMLSDMEKYKMLLLYRKLSTH